MEAGWPMRGVTRVPVWSGIVVAVFGLLPLGVLPAFGGMHPLESVSSLLVLGAALLTVNGIVSHMALDRLLGGRTVRPKAP
jgi:hypothetical protein